MSRPIKSKQQKNTTKSIERSNFQIRSVAKYSHGAEDNAYAEKVHISPRKMENILKSPEMKKAQGTLDSLNKNGRNNIEKIIANPEDKECICQICTCGKHFCPSRKVKYRYPKNMKTSYNQSFYEKPSIGNKQFDYDKDKPKFFIVKDIDKNSTYLHDYPRHHVKPKIVRPVFPSKAELGMPLETTYGNHFPNWNYLDKDTSERMPYGYKPIDFRGDSHYRERFQPPIVDPTKKVVMSNGKNPLDSDFNKATTYRTEFINFNQNKPKRIQIIDQFIPVQSYPCQFDTTVHREFGDKTKKECPVLKYEGVSDMLAKSSLYLNPDRNMSFY